MGWLKLWHNFYRGKKFSITMTFTVAKALISIEKSVAKSYFNHNIICGKSILSALQNPWQKPIFTTTESVAKPTFTTI
ncbi:hypothetical protein GIB67_017479 [Kingdonia uniflora]|uniref:Uncharacterized protein n=1 Tax=Kingdonia uniflora TaxID=39325 RepID=A0A7J7M4G3_9MAGN|nr:hypothetical protein GIB67_017479 [Kingdonia uniflora]